MNEEINKLIEEKLGEWYNSLMEKPFRILDIFNDFFGEPQVDMQGYMDLEGFRSWLHSTPVSRYIADWELVDMSEDEWNTHLDMTIDDLSVSQVTKVVNNFQNIKDGIMCSGFDNIFILVHFPHVRVTNEHDRFVDINHLWAKVSISCNGTLNGTFTLNRSEYTVPHFISNYMHSHVRSIPKSNFTIFQSPCTGDGPINNTIITLNGSYDEDIWNMFCLELSKYVTVESITGMPYHRLESIGIGLRSYGIDRFTTYISYYSCNIPSTIKEFVRYFIGTRKLKFNYVNGSYSIGMSLPEYITLISNEFISWYNDSLIEGTSRYSFSDLKYYGVLKECIISNGKIYLNSSRVNLDCSDFIGKRVCTFKGREITINITGAFEVNSENKSIILDTQIALHILSIILKVLNYRYEREFGTTEGNQLGRKVRYL